MLFRGGTQRKQLSRREARKTEPGRVRVHTAKNSYTPTVTLHANLWRKKSKNPEAHEEMCRYIKNPRCGAGKGSVDKVSAT